MYYTEIITVLMKYIFHISDIHIDIERIKNLQNSFDKLVKDIITKGVDESLLVIVGDIFENKTILTQSDISIFDSMMNLLNKNNIRTFIVVGNHDFNINLDLQSQNNKMVLDILTQSYNNITCLTYTQVYKVPKTNIEFHLYSIVDSKIPEYKENTNIKIALLHDSVNGAKYDNGMKISGSKFNINDFKIYDYTLLGDIHKPQFLAYNIAYCGSFIQKNKGEGLDHGYILWDLENKDNTRFVFIPLIDIMIKIESRDNKTKKLPELKDFQIVKYVQLLYDTNCTIDGLELIKKKMVQKYGRIDKVIPIDKTFHSRITNTKKLLDSSEENPTEFKQVNHEQCIKDILKGKTDDEILKVINYHNKQLSHMKDVNHSNYKINYMSWSNILCYGEDNYLDFRDFNNSIVILNGKNKYGKSSIIDILIRILFNECERGYKKDIVNKTKNSGSIKLSISVQSGFSVSEQGPQIIYDEYIMEQVLVKTEGHTSHKLYKNNEDITKDTIPDTYKYLKEVVGIGCYKDFINMTTALQNRKFLVEMKEDEFLNLLIKLLNIELLENINKTTKSQQSILSHDIKKDNLELVNINNTLESFHQTLIDKDNSIQTNKPVAQDIKKEFSELEEKIKIVKESVESVNTELQKLNKNFDNSIDKKLMTDDETNRIGETLAKIKKQIDKSKFAILDKSLAKIDIQFVLEDIKKYESIINKYKTNYAIEINRLSVDNYECVQIIEDVTDPNISKDEYNILLNNCDSIKIELIKPVVEFKDGNKFQEANLYLSNLGAESEDSCRNKLENLYKKIKNDPDGTFSKSMANEIGHKINKIKIDFELTYGKDINKFENIELEKHSSNISEKKYNEMVNEIKRYVKQISQNDLTIESIDDKILILEKTVCPKKDLLSETLNIEKHTLQEFEQNEIKYRKLVDDSLPDFASLEDEKKSIDVKTKTYNKNYGSIQINQKCSCCISNKLILDKFNINAEIARAEVIKNILNVKTRTIHKYNKYKDIINKIDIYRINVELNKGIIVNNLQFDELSHLRDSKRKLSVLNQVRGYEKIIDGNKMIDHISQFHNFQIQKLQMENYFISKSQIENHNEKINSEIDNLKLILKNILDYKNIISKFNLTKKYLSDLELVKTFQIKISQYETFQTFQIKKKVKIISDKIKLYTKKLDIEKDFEKFIRLENLLTNIISNRTISEKIISLSQNKIDNEVKLIELQNEKEEKNRRISIIDENENRKHILLKNLKSYNVELEFLNMYRRCVDKKKGIAQSILIKLCKKINLECNRILNEISDFNILVEIDTKMMLRIYTIETNKVNPLKIPASMASGYQKFIMDMILRIVLLKDLSGISGNNISNPNILILDEGFGCLDKENFIEVAKILKKLKQCFSCIMIITHINELKSYADKSIDIKRSNQVSKINYCGFEAGSSDGVLGVKSMLKLKLRDCLDEKKQVMEDNRKELNEKQEKKKAGNVEKKLVKDDIAEKKKVDITEKKRLKEVAKAEKESKSTELKEIMESNERVKSFIIEEYKSGDKNVFKCKACDTVYGNTELKLSKHVGSVRLMVKHRKYITTLI
jgi:DNA repair exonuclease SbcCD ATPase subunit